MDRDTTDRDTTVTHPRLESLLSFADGAGDPYVSEHLLECAQCANWLEELREGETAYREDWHTALKSSAQPPPFDWPDLDFEPKKINAPRLMPPRPQPHKVRWGAIAASVLAAFAIGQWWFSQKVSAAELLRRASNQRIVSPDNRISIELRTRTSSVIRPALWSRRSSTRPVSRDVIGMQSLFESARYDWEDPLSAQAFAAWRQSLADRQDTVRKLVTSKQEDAYEIRTRTSHGPLAEAILTLRTIDLKPVRETLEFRDSQRIEITEVSRPEQENEVPVEEPRLAKAIVQPVSAEEELAVWEALHRAGADTGEPVEVDRKDESVVVTALGLSPARRAALAQALAGIGRVDLRFQEPQQLRASPQAAAAREAGPSSPLQSKLEARFGGAQGAEDFIDNVLESTESAMVRAHAIRKLAERFPAGNTLDVDNRKRLSNLAMDHLQALEASSAKVIKSAGEITTLTKAVTGHDANPWQQQAATLVEKTQRVDRVLTQLLAVRGQSINETELDEALAQWQAAVQSISAAIGANR